jgi:hypothetical protein
MFKRIFNQTTITGIGSILLSILPYFQDDSKMNTTSWTLVGIGIALTLLGCMVGIFKRSWSIHDIEALMEDRRKVLPELQKLVEERIKRLNQLVEYAIKYPLDEYYKKYFYKQKLDSLLSRPVAILKIFAINHFELDNLYYEQLKRSDTSLKQILVSYELTYNRVNDNKLKRYLRQLWRYQHNYNSQVILANISKQNKNIHNWVSGYKLGRLGEQINDYNFNRSLKLVNNRIDYLLEGRDREM